MPLSLAKKIFAATEKYPDTTMVRLALRGTLVSLGDFRKGLGPKLFAQCSKQDGFEFPAKQ